MVAVSTPEREAYRTLNRAYTACYDELRRTQELAAAYQLQTARQAARLDATIRSREEWKRIALDLTEANERFRRAVGEWGTPEVA